MSERKYLESPDDREKRECHESIRAEPEWKNIETSKAWLEERYPLLDDASLGSPLFRYMKACVKDQNHMWGRAPVFLASMLSFHESMRYSGETCLTVGFDPTQEKLYPGYGFPNQDRASEPIWSDRDASRTWLEQRYPLGRASLGSPLYRYMQACRESRYIMCSPTTHLGSMLTDSEWERFCIAYPNSARHRHRDKPDPILLYPEYDNRMWPTQGPCQRSTDSLQLSPGWPDTKSLPPPGANPPTSAYSYTSHLRQSLSSSPSNKRKGDDGDDTSPERPANKRRRNPSDLSGGVVMSAKLLNPYEEGHEGLRQQDDTESMPPPPRPQRKAASVKSYPGTMNLGQQRNNKEEGSSNRQDATNVTGTPPRPAPKLVEAREDPRVLGLHRQSTDLKTAGDLGHQPHGQHTNGPTVPNDKDASHEPANNNPCPLRPYPQPENQAHIEENPDAMDIDSDDFGHQTSASPAKIPLADPSRKRGIEDVEHEQPESSSSKKRRASPDTGGDDSLISSPPMETPSRKKSIEYMEDAPQTTSSPEWKQTPPNSGGNELPPSSPFDPPERSSPTPFKTPTGDGTRGKIPDPAPLRRESTPYEDPTTVIFRSNHMEGPVLQSGSQPRATDGGRDPEATLNSGSETQKPGNDRPVPPEPESQGEHHVDVGEDPDDMIIDSEHPRDQTTANIIHNSGDRKEQIAISVVIPLQIPQRQPIANQELSPDEDTMNVPVIQKKRKGGRNPGTKGRKNRQSKPEPGQQAYVGRLRSGVGERKHKKPRLVILEFKGRKAIQVRAN